MPSPSGQELVVMVGLQGCGKSTWTKDPRAPRHSQARGGTLHGGHARRREARQRRLVGELLAEGRSVVVDNTDAAPEDRAPLVELARRAGVPVRAVWVDTPVDACIERNDAREGRVRVPLVGVLATRARLIPPSVAEGFDRVDSVR